jgi:hypothetical protein
MSGLTGKTKTTSGTPAELLPLRRDLSSFIIGHGFNDLGLGKDAVDITPYQQMFAANREQALAQAKESAGNLTGTDYGGILGRAAGQSALQENAFLADLMERQRQAKYQRYLQLIGGFANSGVGSPQTVYEPGFLDSIISAGTNIATAYAGRPSNGGTPKP